jgi:hypothetical protein
MSFPSGSTLKVLLLNGASPNTGPFDLYVNSITASSGILIANDVSKATLSGSGYEFITPIETYQVWAKSDSTITNADVFILGNIPGVNGSVSVTGSYEESLTAGQVTASVFFDNGYGLQNSGTIPSAFNVCPSTVGIGTASINNIYNTLVVLKTHETSSEYIRFFANNGLTSGYFYHLPSSASVSAFKAVNTLNICVDLSSGNYQTVPTNSINVYPTASIITTSQKLGDANAYELWIQLKANGVLIYSGSSTGTGFNSGVPGNAIVEYTASIPQISSWTSGNAFTSSLQVQNLLRYNSPEYALDPMVNLFQNVILSSSISENTLQYSFPAVPGGYYELDADGNVSGVNYAYSASLCGTGQTSSFISDDELVSGNVYKRFFFDNPSWCATVTFVKVTSQAPTANTSWQPVSGCGDPEC